METTRRRALGRGLEELFSGEVLDFDSLEEKIIEETPKEEIMQVKLSELRSNPYQPRKVFDENALNELANSIKEHGVFQPIIIKRSIKGYEIVAGERRAKASKLAGRETIPAIVRDFNDQEMMEIALLENLQREDLNPIEEAMAYQNLMNSRGLNHEQLAERIGKSRSYVTNMVGLMNLPDSVKELVIAKKISATHARTLSKIKDPLKVEEMADRIINEGLTTAAIDELAKDKTVEKRNKMERRETEENRTYKYIQDLLCDRLSTKVRIRGTKIEINFQDLEDFNRIIEALKLDE
ncbi:MAG: ParB/RepB/Spo0J family partition protein [Bacilli bacterium]|nr:ParB/RepB/Spo0J family partition protein [Bacilli bacterium]